MSVTFGFFDSVNSDRIYDSNDFSNYFKGLIGDGIYQNFLHSLHVIADPEVGLGIIVKSGKATIGGRWLLNDSDYKITLEPGGMIARQDCVVVQLDLTNRMMSLKVISWEDYTSNSEAVNNLALARITVGKNATSIRDVDIYDMRPMSGFVTGLIKQVDTADLFTQYQASIKEKEAAFNKFFVEKQAAFDSWFEQLTSKLIVNTTIKEHSRVIPISSNITYMAVRFDDCTTNDIVDVHLNGVWLNPSIDFDVVKDGTGISVQIIRTMSKGDMLNVRVLKSEIGDEILTASGDTLYVG